MGILARHIDPDYIEHEVKLLARHINGMREEDLADPDAVIEAWAKQRIVDKPRIAREQAAAPTTQAAPAPVRQVPISNGTSPHRPGGPGVQQTLAEKTAAPGKVNSMTEDEWRRHKREQGYTF